VGCWARSLATVQTRASAKSAEIHTERMCIDYR
jgi:hypothetical protein